MIAQKKFLGYFLWIRIKNLNYSKFVNNLFTLKRYDEL